MITAKQFELLKKGNAAVNAEKCKVRVPAAFKSATTEQRKQIFELSGLKSPNSFYPIEKSGSASPKVVLSLAQVLGISPYFLSGESDSEKPCDDAVLNEFFKLCTGGKAKAPKAKKTAPKSKKATATKAKPPVAKKVADKPVAKKSTPATTKQTTTPAKAVKPITAKAVADKKKITPPVKPQKANPAPAKPIVEKTTAPIKPIAKAEKAVKLDDNSLVKLLEALAIRAKFGGEAEVTYNKVVELLKK